MDHEPDIKRRRDGSIDTDYYMQIGRQKRSEQANRMVSFVLRRSPRRTIEGSWLARLVPFRRA